MLKPPSMQITHNNRNVIWWVLRIVTLCVCGWFIFSKVTADWSFDAATLSGKWHVLLLVSVLTVVNWGLEVCRWKLSLDSLMPTSWTVAMQQVFSGQALNWVMPFTTGDLLARLLPQADRKQVGVLIYFNRALMLGITLIVGSYGVYVYSRVMFVDKVWAFVVVMLAMLSAGYLLRRYFSSGERPIGKRLLVHLAVLSVVRYTIFAWQFYLLIALFNPSLPAGLIVAGVGWVFLFRSVLPSFFGQLGVREASALLFFELHVSNMALILLPSLLIWLVNSVAPSVVGLYFLLRFRLNLAKSD